jgi:hypothetical protein
MLVDTVVALRRPGSVDDALTDLLRVSFSRRRLKLKSRMCSARMPIFAPRMGVGVWCGTAMARSARY